MLKLVLFQTALLSALLLGTPLPFAAAQQAQKEAVQQEPSSGVVYRVEVDMVLLNVAVTDNKGRYVTGLVPSDFQIEEDGVPQKMASFAEGNEAPRPLSDFAALQSHPLLVKPSEAVIPNSLDPGGVPDSSDGISSAVAGASVYVLFDTSNYMYQGFVYAQDAIAAFIRSLDHPDRVALYSYSRDFSRDTPLTTDRSEVLRGLRSTVAGDDAALYNALLLTMKDAAKQPGRKVVVVFSNGPDNASMVAPEDVREFAQAEGISIYMVSTREAQHDQVSTAVFQRMSLSTGGKAYFAKDWQAQQSAFTSIRDDLDHLYSLAYYPQPNPNRGWRSITVKLVGNRLKGYQIRTRTGYRPLATRSSG